jgi:hypothetical protein
MEKLELRFTYEKETKNTVRYQEELGEEAHSSRDIAVGTIYIQKEVLGEPAPQRLKVTIEEDTNGN